MQKEYWKIDQIDEIINLWKDTWVYYEPEDTYKSLKNLIEYDSKSIHLIIEDTKIIASAVLVYNPFQSFIYRFCVSEKYRWKWVWSKLSDFIEDTLKSRWMFHPTIFVEEWNDNGLKFWEKMWWENLYKVHCLVKDLNTPLFN